MRFAEFLLLFLTFPDGHACVGLTVGVIVVYLLIMHIGLLIASVMFWSDVGLCRGECFHVTYTNIVSSIGQ